MANSEITRISGMQNQRNKQVLSVCKETVTKEDNVLQTFCPAEQPPMERTCSHTCMRELLSQTEGICLHLTNLTGYISPISQG